MTTTDGDHLGDARRLGELRALAILDTPPERDYDDLAALASTVTASRVAAVNFVDGERHFTKASVGLPAQGGSVPFQASFCAATVNEPDGVLVIEDTRADPDWRDHPLVKNNPEVGFYAGAAVYSQGERVGVVCAFGPEPREITAEQRHGLTLLARQVEAQLRLRRLGIPRAPRTP